MFALTIVYTDRFDPMPRIHVLTLVLDIFLVYKRTRNNLPAKVVVVISVSKNDRNSCTRKFQRKSMVARRRHRLDMMSFKYV